MILQFKEKLLLDSARSKESSEESEISSESDEEMPKKEEDEDGEKKPVEVSLETVNPPRSKKGISRDAFEEWSVVTHLVMITSIVGC